MTHNAVSSFSSFSAILICIFFSFRSVNKVYIVYQLCMLTFQVCKAVTLTQAVWIICVVRSSTLLQAVFACM